MTGKRSMHWTLLVGAGCSDPARREHRDHAFRRRQSLSAGGSEHPPLRVASISRMRLRLPCPPCPPVNVDALLRTRAIRFAAVVAVGLVVGACPGRPTERDAGVVVGEGEGEGEGE